ncbi:MAG: hypothetical protein WBE90_04845, partial [Xanthobacteraceae bacterium]
MGNSRHGFMDLNLLVVGRACDSKRYLAFSSSRRNAPNDRRYSGNDELDYQRRAELQLLLESQRRLSAVDD